MSDRSLIRFSLAAVVAVACGMFFYTPAHGQAAKAHGYEWTPSDYGGFSLMHNGKVVGVVLPGGTYFTIDGKTWVEAQLPAPKPLPPPVAPPAASCPAGGCGVTSVAAACGTASVGRVFAEFRPVRAVFHRVRGRFGRCG